MEAFKMSVGDKQFYFKTRDGGESYVIEPYQQTGVRPFKLVKSGDSWIIPAEEKVPDSIRNMESGFGDRIHERQLTGS